MSVGRPIDNRNFRRKIMGSDRRPETISKELKEKLLGSDREGLGIGLGLGIRITDLNQIADLNLTRCIFVTV